MSNLKEKIELDVELAELKAEEVLSTYPRWQKWVVAVSLLLVIPGYFLTKKISSVYYGKRYQTYLITAKPSFSDPKDIEVGSISLYAINSTDYAVSVQVTNPNLDLAAKNLSYTFSFLSKSGSEAALPERGRFYLLPNQRKYLIVPRVTLLEPIDRTVLEIQEEVEWQKKTDLPEVELLTSKPSVYKQSDPEVFVLEGSLTNDSPYFLKEVRLTLLLQDFQGKTVAASQRTEFSLKPYEKRDYKHLWPGFSGSTVASAEALAETNLLDKENLALPDIPSNGAGGLSR